MMDLTKLSDADLMALKGGDLSKVSDDGLMVLKGVASPKQADTGRGGLAQNVAGGLLKGASEIGATLMAPVDAAARALGVQNSYIGRTDRRQAVDAFMKNQGVDTDSLGYGAGKFGAEVAGTAGAGGALAGAGLKAVNALAPRAAGAVSPFLDAIASGGMQSGAGLATRAAGGAVAGGASAGLVNPSDAGVGAVFGGAFPVAARGVSAAAGGLAKSVLGNVSPEVAALYRKAQQMGVEIPADRIVNSRPMNALAAGLNYVPFSGRAATEDAMNAQLNRAASRTFGQDSSNITMALRKAETDLGGKFEDTLSKTGVIVDSQFLNDLANVFNKAESELGSDALKPIAAKIDQLIEKGASGMIDGKAAYVVKRDLDRIGGQNTPQAFHAIELKKRLMDALSRSLGPNKSAEFDTVRQQYGNMMDFQKLAKNGVEGEVSIARLANMKNINNPELQDIADVAAQFVKPREGQHGAAQRALAGGVTFGLGGAPALGVGVGVGRAANTALNSNMLKNMMLNGRGAQAPNSMLDALRLGGYQAAPMVSGALAQ